MSTHTNLQIIKDTEGNPAFAVLPFSEYLALAKPRATIPNEVVWAVIDKGWSLPRAWREHLGLTQKELAERMGITQAALSQSESENKKLRKPTLQKLAQALGLDVEQLRS